MTNKFLNNIKRDKQGGCMAILNYNMSEKIFLSEGAFLITTGLIIIYLSQITQITFPSLLGFALFFIGLYNFINAIIVRKDMVVPFLSLISAILITLTGLYLISNPIIEPVFMVIATIMYLLTDCTISLAAAAESFGVKQVFLIGTFTGLVQLGLAAAVFYSIPFYDVWISGLALGINFVFSGIMYITKYSYFKKPAYCVC